jgi:LPXTG-site transpeptidase (sortase) family protein
LLVIVSLIGAGICGWFYAEARLYQAYESWRLNQIMKHRPADLKTFLASYLGGRAIEAMKEPPAVKGPTELPAASPSAALAVGVLIGRLEIPRLGLSTVVLEGDGDQVLRKGVGHIPSTALPGGSGNVAIAGHRDTFFRALQDIRRDDDITLATTTETYHYRVDSVQVVRPNDTQVLAPSDRPSLTLVTCYPFHFVGSAPERYIVHAQETEPSGVVHQALGQSQLGPSSGGSAEGCPSAATVPPTPEPGPDLLAFNNRAECRATRIADGLATGGNRILYQLKMTLQDIYPLIWLRIQLCQNETLTELRRERDPVNARIAAALESFMDGEELTQQHQATARQYEQLKQGGQEAWKKMKPQMDAAMDELEEAYERLASRFQEHQK